MFKVGDIVRHSFLKDITGIIVGYGIGNAFAPRFGFKPYEQIALIATTGGTVIPIRADTTDYEVIHSVETTNIANEIHKAKEKWYAFLFIWSNSIYWAC